MDISVKALLIVTGLTSLAVAQAQAPPPPPAGTADPAAASTPHQREATGDKASEAPAGGSPEASAASSPHQKSAVGEGAVSDAKLRMAQQDGAIPATFVKKAALDGMTEVELGKVALSKSQDEKVRKFADRMIADHGKANAELASIAKGKNLEVPKALDSEHQMMVQSLSSKSGAAFDAAYGEHMSADHAKAVALFEGASTSTDRDLAAFAKKTLPTLKEHKKLAEGLPGTRTADASDDTSKR
jgi:putative membrane protein